MGSIEILNIQCITLPVLTCLLIFYTMFINMNLIIKLLKNVAQLGKVKMANNVFSLKC